MGPHREDTGADEPIELAALADGTLTPERRAALEASVAGSPELQARLAEQQRALTLIHGAAADVEAPAGLRRRVDAKRSARRRRPMRAPLAVGGAAVALAVGLVALLLVTRSGTNAQQFHVALAGTPLAAGASGTATLTQTPSGWRIELRAPGLPRLQDGRFYEAWLKDDAGTLVPVGTFNDGRKVTLWAGVSPKDFPTLSVTRERADGNQGSSGEKVLVGTVATGP
jgi:Anti-sigma-K factor rskA